MRLHAADGATNLDGLLLEPATARCGLVINGLGGWYPHL